MLGIDPDIPTGNLELNKSITADICTWFKTVSGIVILHLNIRSIRKNWNELCVVLQNHKGKYDVLVLTEISIYDERDNCIIEGYRSCIRARQGRRGGGIAIFIKETWSFEEDKIIQSNEYEGVSLSLNRNNVSFALLAIYRPPNKNKSIFINDLETHLLGNGNLIVIGDMNIDLLDTTDNNVLDYIALLAAFGLDTCIDDPTREEMRNDTLTSTCIDHIFIRYRNKNKASSVIYKTKLSDHYLVGISISNTQCDEAAQGPSQSVPDNDEASVRINNKLLDKLLLATDWSQCAQMHDSTDIYNFIINTHNRIKKQASYTAHDTSKNKPKKSWITSELLEIIQNRDKAFEKWKNCKTLLKRIYRATYKNLRNQATKQLNIARINFYKQKLELSDANSKNCWDTINELMGKKRRESADEVVTRYMCKKASVDTVTNKFADTFSREIEQIQHHCHIVTLSPPQQHIPQEQCLLIKKITPRQVKDILTTMDAKKQPGIDDIKVSSIRNAIEKMAQPITHLINSSLQTRKVPNKMKIAIVKPIYKKGDHCSYSNYRPISILPVLEKCMERYIAIHLSKYLAEYNIINKSQFGFQKGKGTTDLLILFANHVNSNLNHNNHALALFLDFSKAFDTLQHYKLIEALQQIGIGGNLLGWFMSYLEDRKFIVKIKDTVSMQQHCYTGSPQGSILSPILYLIYVNSMFSVINKTKMYMYADDTVMISVHHELAIAEKNLQEDFNQVSRWTHDNNLVLNAAKSKVMHISSPFNREFNTPINLICHSQACLHNNIDRPQIECNNIECNDSTIENVHTYVYLGLTVDRIFSWRPHIDMLANRLRISLYHIYKLNFIVPKGMIRNVYCAIVESIMMYGLMVWGHASKGHLQCIINLQNKIIKIVCPHHIVKQESNIAQLYYYCDLLPLIKLFKYLYTIKYFFCAKYKNVITHNVNTRQQTHPLLIVPIHKNKYGLRTLKIFIPSLFNLLPDSIQTLEKYSEIKNKTKKWLLIENE
jgi:hypothetical protein